MKKFMFLAACCLMLLLLTACAADTDESSKTVTPTGYPKGQIQNDCVFYAGKVWFQGTVSRRTSSMKEVGEVKSVDDCHLPSEDFAACHLKVGDKILVLEEGGKLRLFVQRKDINRLDEFYFVEEENTSSAPSRTVT